MYNKFSMNGYSCAYGYFGRILILFSVVGSGSVFGVVSNPVPFVGSYKIWFRFWGLIGSGCVCGVLSDPVAFVGSYRIWLRLWSLIGSGSVCGVL